MATAYPLARYSAINGALASGFATAELHYLLGRDRKEHATHRSTAPSAAMKASGEPCPHVEHLGGQAWDMKRMEVQMSCLSYMLRRNAGVYASAIALTAMAGAMSLPSAHADEAQAKDLFKAMSDYMGAQDAISFNYDSSLEIITKQDQKIAFTSSGSVTMNRPDKIRATRTGGFADVEMVFDGKTLSLLGKNLNLYTQAEVSGTIDHLVDELREKFHRPMPAADLLMANPNDQLMPLVTDVKDLGSGVIRGEECDHLAFRTKQVDFQIWIHQGDRPYPCRYVITSTKVEGWPQYTIDVRDWKSGSEVAADDFSFKAPADAKLLKPGDLPNMDDLPSELVKGLPK